MIVDFLALLVSYRTLGGNAVLGWVQVPALSLSLSLEIRRKRNIVSHKTRKPVTRSTHRASRRRDRRHLLKSRDPRFRLLLMLR